MKPDLQYKDLAKNELCSLAEKLGDHLRAGDSIFLKGPIGVGKTFVIGCLIRKKLLDIGIEQHVTSPTFNLVQIYDELYYPIWHIDLYRLKNQEELIEIGLEEAFHEAICLLEWPDILGETTIGKAVVLSIRFSTLDSNKRDLDIFIPEKNFNNKKYYVNI